VDDLLAQTEVLTVKNSTINKKLKQHTTDLEKEAARTAAATDELTATSTTLHKTETKVIQLEEQLAEETSRAAALEKEKKKLQKDLDDLSATDDLEAKVTSLQSQLRVRNTELEEANEECDRVSDLLAKAEREKSALEVRARAAVIRAALLCTPPRSFLSKTCTRHATRGNHQAYLSRQLRPVFVCVAGSNAPNVGPKVGRRCYVGPQGEEAQGAAGRAARRARLAGRSELTPLQRQEEVGG
jgi:TolA-binding protein